MGAPRERSPDRAAAPTPGRQSDHEKHVATPLRNVRLPITHEPATASCPHCGDVIHAPLDPIARDDQPSRPTERRTVQGAFGSLDLEVDSRPDGRPGGAVCGGLDESRSRASDLASGRVAWVGVPPGESVKTGRVTRLSPGVCWCHRLPSISRTAATQRMAPGTYRLGSGRTSAHPDCLGKAGNTALIDARSFQLS